MPLALVLAGPVQARDYGQQGTVFPLIERDLLQQIHARLLAMEQSGETARLNEELKRRTVARVERPEPVAGLVRAQAARQWSFDPTITLETDIRGAKGELIHARGTRVNPLDSVELRADLLFFDGDDPDQLAWALRQSPGAKLILVRGAPLQLMKARQRRFYFDQGGKLSTHFAIRAVPARVRQQGRLLEVSEIVLPQAKGARP
ncbi:type-F conjugative transfer system protein TraW [Novosphingobium sediminis]|uniref:Type-F conjugative transfer system protein TraW n=1 Tax=Novosphingobium sediminis TaxID=707214 RepID=A0A512AQP4_9SPHN|nr:type-F conjugative transfer system protein TraW [Novosphingobium sediminis]